MSWEYHIENSEIVERWSKKKQAQEVAAFNQRLNLLGSEGWEMIGFNSVPLTGSFSKDIKGYTYLTFFKRQR